jgi:CTP synthase
MVPVGINPESNLVEIMEIPEHKWFIGVQFHPEYSSTVINPHPLFVQFVKACITT